MEKKQKFKVYLIGKGHGCYYGEKEIRIPI